ncbi:Cytochrome P450, partial [Metarhizium brunneum ARSEF 3297]
MGQTIVVVNDVDIAQDLLEMRSKTNASRPSSVVIGELTGWNRIVSVQGDRDIVRVHRRCITKCIGSTKAFAGFNDQLDIEACHLMLRIMKQPDDLANHIRRQTGSIILNIVYGYSVEPHEQDPLVELADLSTTQFSMAAEPGAWLIDIFPILKYLPMWFPGASIQRKAREWRTVLETLAEKPYAFVLDRREQNTYKKSYVSEHLDQLGREPTSEEEFTIKWTAATIQFPLSKPFTWLWRYIQKFKKKPGKRYIGSLEPTGFQQWMTKNHFHTSTPCF